VGYVARTEIKNACRILVKNIMGRDHVGNLRADNKIILKWVLRDDKMWIGVMWLRLLMKVAMVVRAF
jgi:hypothetical protein